MHFAHKSLSDAQVVLYLVFRKVVPLLTRVANAVPAPDSKLPLRPPGAFSVRIHASCNSPCIFRMTQQSHYTACHGVSIAMSHTASSKHSDYGSLCWYTL